MTFCRSFSTAYHTTASVKSMSRSRLPFMTAHMTLPPIFFVGLSANLIWQQFVLLIVPINQQVRSKGLQVIYTCNTCAPITNIATTSVCHTINHRRPFMTAHMAFPPHFHMHPQCYFSLISILILFIIPILHQIGFCKTFL